MFNIIYLVSAGEPDSSTDILISEAYRWAFTRNNRYGYASAYAVLIFFILLGLAYSLPLPLGPLVFAAFGSFGSEKVRFNMARSETRSSFVQPRPYVTVALGGVLAECPLCSS